MTQTNTRGGRSAADVCEPRAHIGQAALLLVMTVWTGATMLGGQVAWMRLAQVWIGSGLLSAAIALAAAMIGLAIGAGLAGRLAARASTGLALVQQALTGAALLASPTIIFLAGESTATIACVLTFLNIPFGMLLPTVVELDARRRDGQLVRRGGLFYAIQSGGAVLGAIVLGLLLPAVLGFDRMLWIASAGHALVLLGLLASRRRWPGARGAGALPAAEVSEYDASGESRTPKIRGVAFLAAWLGMFGLAAELVWLRGLSFYVGGNLYTFALTTAAFVGSLAIGSTLGAVLAGSQTETGVLARLADSMIGRRPGQFLAGVLLLLASAIALSDFCIEHLPFDERAAGPLLVSLPRQFLLILLIVGPSAGLMGLAFPMLLRLAGPGQSGNAGRIVGRIVAFNALGSGLGVALVYGVLLAMLDQRRAMLGIAVGYLVAALLAEVLDPATGWHRSRPRAAGPDDGHPDATETRRLRLRKAREKRIPWPNIVLFVVAGGLCVWQAYGGPMFRQAYLRGEAADGSAVYFDESAEQDTLAVHVYESADAVVATRRRTATGALELLINREIQGDDSPLATRVQRLTGVLPLLLATDQSWSRTRFAGRASTPLDADALVIGLGTGTTVAPLVQADLARIVIAELADGVIKAAMNEFGHANGDLRGTVVRKFEPPRAAGPTAASQPAAGIATQPAADDARTQVLLVGADGRELLRRSPGGLKIILVDIIYPTAPGAGGLFSRQFYKLAADKLAQDGIFVHWLPLWQMRPTDVSSVVRAFLDGFADAGFRGGYVMLPHSGRAMVALIASHRPIDLSSATLTARLDRLRPLLDGRSGDVMRPALAELGVDSPEQLLAGMVNDSLLRAWAGDAPATTDEFPRAELHAALADQTGFGRDNIRRLLEVGFGQPGVLGSLAPPADRKKIRDMLASRRLLAMAFAMPRDTLDDEVAYYNLIKESAGKDASNAFAWFAVQQFEYDKHIGRIESAVNGSAGPNQPGMTHQQAIEELTKLDQQFPFETEALISKAQLQKLVGKFDDAVTTLDQLLTRFPASADIYYRKAIWLVEQSEQVGKSEPDKARELATNARQALILARRCRAAKPVEYEKLADRIDGLLK